jgi:hypothetical protein
MAKKYSGSIGGTSSTSPQSKTTAAKSGTRGTRPSETKRPSALLDTRAIYCGDNLEQLAKLPDACNSALRTPQSAIAVAGSFYYHCDWHASHYVKVMLDQIFGENNFNN